MSLINRKKGHTHTTRWLRCTVHAVVWVTDVTKYPKEVTIEKVNHLLTTVGGKIIKTNTN